MNHDKSKDRDRGMISLLFFLYRDKFRLDLVLAHLLVVNVLFCFIKLKRFKSKYFCPVN